MTCEHKKCNKEFTPKSNLSKFCSVKCKQAAYRERAKVIKQVEINNLPENKKRILAERNNIIEDCAFKQPLTPKDCVKVIDLTPPKSNYTINTKLDNLADLL